MTHDDGPTTWWTGPLPETPPLHSYVQRMCNRPRRKVAGPSVPLVVTGMAAGGAGEPTCRRDSVPRSLAGVRFGDHPSLRPTRGVPLTGPDGPSVSSARPCSGWGLPSRRGRPRRWCALTAPFHPCLCAAPGSCAIGGLFSVARNRQIAPTWLSPAPCPVESRPSSTPRATPDGHTEPRSPGRLTSPTSVALPDDSAESSHGAPLADLSR